MSIVIRLIAHFYALLRRLYPREFRAEFGEEMQAVFAEAVEAAAKRGRVSLLAMCLRELRDLPKSLLREYWLAFGWQKGRTRMDEPVNINRPMSNPSITFGNNHQPGSWKDAALAGLPHLLAVMLALLPLGAFKYGSAFVPILLLPLVCFIVAALALAWRRGWPRWAASWYVYAALMVVMFFGIPIQQSNIPFGKMLEGAYFSVAVPLVSAAWLYGITRRDRIMGLLTAMPLVLGSWLVTRLSALPRAGEAT